MMLLRALPSTTKAMMLQAPHDSCIRFFDKSLQELRVVAVNGRPVIAFESRCCGYEFWLARAPGGEICYAQDCRGL